MDGSQPDREAFRRKGYLVLPDRFSAAELADLRERALRSRGQPGDLLSQPLLADALLDDRVLDCARALLDDPRPVYFGNSTCNYETHPPQNFHKDNTDRYDPNGPDWAGDYSILRIGLYLQDQVNHSGGLVVRAGSHRSASRTAGRPVYLGPAAGDLVVWDLRTTHRGRASLYRFTRRPVSWRWDRRLPGFLRAESDADRIALFMTFGKDDRHLARYLTYLRTREVPVRRWLACKYEPGVLARARAKGLVVRDMRAELERDPPTTLSRKHRQIAY